MFKLESTEVSMPMPPVETLQDAEELACSIAEQCGSNVVVRDSESPEVATEVLVDGRVSWLVVEADEHDHILSNARSTR